MAMIPLSDSLNDPDRHGNSSLPTGRFISGYIVCNTCLKQVNFKELSAMNTALAIKFQCIDCLSK